MANISEGYGRYHYLDSLRFYYIARGSINETINHVITAHDLHYIDQEQFHELYELGRETERTLNGYLNYIRGRQQGVAEYGNSLVTETPIVYEVPFQDSDE